MRLVRLIPVVVLGILNACGGGDTTEPTPVGDSAPTPRPTPAATAAPTPNAYAAACGSPLPDIADTYGFAVKVQLEPTARKKILNASPLVRNGAYCASVGLSGAFCETRFETDPARVACDHYIAGISDEGGPGPSWYRQVGDRLLRCPGVNSAGEASGCRLKPENQYLLDVFEPGTYVACGGKGSNGSCGLCVLSEASYETPPDKIGTRRPGLCSGT